MTATTACALTGNTGPEYAGVGDDLLDAPTAASGVVLGPGADTYLGGRGPDFVKVLAIPAAGRPSATGRSTSSTPAGKGHHLLEPRKANADTINVGAGASMIYWSGYQTGGRVDSCW